MSERPGEMRRLRGCAHDLAKSHPFSPAEILGWLTEAYDHLKSQGVPDPEETALNAFEPAADVAKLLNSPLHGTTAELSLLRAYVADAESFISWCRRRHEEKPIGDGENVGRWERELDDWLYRAKRTKGSWP